MLHSLNLKQSGTQPYGEVDFVVLIPGAGVFCLEVKGGRVACNDGAWTTTDASGATFPLKRSPFSQAQDGMHEVRKSLEERLASAPDFYQVPFGYAVVFTDVEAPPPDIGTEPWEVIDHPRPESRTRGPPPQSRETAARKAPHTFLASRTAARTRAKDARCPATRFREDRRTRHARE